MLFGGAEIGAIKQITNKHEKSKAFIHYYNNVFLKQLKQADTSDNKQLKLILQNFFEITFYVENKEIVKQYLHYFKIYEKNGLAKTIDVKNMYHALIKNRMFKQAKLFFDTHEGVELEKLPNFVNGYGFNEQEITIFALDAENKNTLIKQNFNFSKNTELIIISHPRCHFCYRAAKHIKKDRVLSQFLSKHAHWFSPPDSAFYLDDISQWNNKFPNFTMKYIETSLDFPMLDYWGTPSFYFLTDGKVVDKLVGWPKEGRLKELKLLMRKNFIDYDSI